MLKIDFKKMTSLFTNRQVEDFLSNNFFQLKTTDVMRIRKLITWNKLRTNLLADAFVEQFKDKKSIMYLALTMLRRTYGDDIKAEDIWSLPDKQYWAFWKFADKIAEYKNDQRANSRRAHKRYLTAQKKCATLNKRGAKV